MHNDKGQVTDWLEQIVKEPDEWQMFFSSSEVKMLAEDSLDLLKEQESWINEIAEYQKSISGSGMHELDDYEKGKWDGLQIAWNIISEGR